MHKDYVKLAGSGNEISEEIKASRQSVQFLEVTYKKIRKQLTSTIDKLPNENKVAMFDGLCMSSISDSNIMLKDNLMQ